MDKHDERLINAAADILMHCVDSLCSAGLFNEVDSLSHSIDLEALDTNLLVVLLGVTFPARHMLNRREELVVAVEHRLRELAPDRVDALMRGLR